MVIVDFVLNYQPQEAITSVINGLIVLTQGHVLTKIEKAMARTMGWRTQFRVSRVLGLVLMNPVTSDTSPNLVASPFLHL